MTHFSVFLLDLEGDVKAVAIPIRGVEIDEPRAFMERVRTKAGEVDLQAIDARFVADADHLWAVIRQAWTARKRGSLRVKFDMDILLRIACDPRVTHALATVGLKKGVLDVVFVAVGRQDRLQPVAEHLGHLGEVSESLLKTTPEKEEFLRGHHRIGDLALQSTLLNRGCLAAVLAEKAAISLLR